MCLAENEARDLILDVSQVVFILPNTLKNNPKKASKDTYY